MPRSLPSVTVIVPVRNEAESIDACMESLVAQDYEGDLTVVVADGGSTDATRDRLAAWEDDGLSVIDNPDLVQAIGMNRAAAVAKGDILVRADAHTTYSPVYVRRSVAAIEEPRTAAGGVMTPVGTKPFGRAVAAAMKSPLTIGPGKFHYATEVAEVDTVYLGAFRREGFLAIGGMRRFPSGVAEDADFYYRWREAGGRVVVDPGIASTYRPRERPGALFRQYLRYGEGKAEMLFVNRRLPSWRPLAPLGLVLALVAAAALAITTPLPLLAVGALWLAPVLFVALRAGALAPLVLLAAVIMHIAYGLGMIIGLVRGRRARKMIMLDSSVRRMRGVVPPPARKRARKANRKPEAGN